MAPYLAIGIGVSIAVFFLLFVGIVIAYIFHDSSEEDSVRTRTPGDDSTSPPGTSGGGPFVPTHTPDDDPFVPTGVPEDGAIACQVPFEWSGNTKLGEDGKILYECTPIKEGLRKRIGSAEYNADHGWWEIKILPQEEDIDLMGDPTKYYNFLLGETGFPNGSVGDEYAEECSENSGSWGYLPGCGGGVPPGNDRIIVSRGALPGDGIYYDVESMNRLGKCINVKDRCGGTFTSSGITSFYARPE